MHKAPMRIMMAGESFSPEYWRAHHACLIDMVRQVGWPTLFVTIAPWEWSFPYHVWIMDEMVTMLRSRLHLPAAETLHLAHVLTQCVKGLLAGSTNRHNGNDDEVFHEHIFQDPESKQRCRITFFGRIEFQDGKRKRYVRGNRPVSHTYHGRGTPHLHVLFWLEPLSAAGLAKTVAATADAGSAPMDNIIWESQRDWNRSGWPIRAEESACEGEPPSLQLQHSDADWWHDIWVYITDVVLSLKCHFDVVAEGRAAVLRCGKSRTRIQGQLLERMVYLPFYQSAPKSPFH